MIRVDGGSTLLLGGARSGKSALAQRLAESWPGAIVFVATAAPGDVDMADRIARHRAERPAGWGLVEAPRFDAQALASIDDETLVVLDCITMLVANLFFDEASPQQIVDHAGELAMVASTRSAPTLIVSNEVGMGIHPETALGRRYRDLLGRVNRVVADHVDRSLFVAAGRVFPLEEVQATW